MTLKYRIFKKVAFFFFVAFLLVFCCSMFMLREWSKSFILCDYEESVENCTVTETFRNGRFTYIWCEESKYIIPLYIGEDDESLGHFVRKKDRLYKDKNSDKIIITRNELAYSFVLVE